jgi:hypothetical protein
MADQTSDDIQKKIATLPPEVRRLLYSTEMSGDIQQIGARHQLHVDQVGALEAEVAAVMIGVTQSNELAENIADALNLDRAKSEEIATDVGNTIFAKIRDAMKQGPAQAAPAEKSVVMPSRAAAPKPPAPTPPMPATPPVAPKPPVPAPPAVAVVPPKPAAPPAPPKPAPPPAMPPSVNAMLTQPTASMPKKEEPPKPGPSYKADPYREPVE